MKTFHINWRGCTGPQEIIVQLHPGEVAERLAIATTLEHEPGDFFDPSRVFEGEVVDTQFWIRAQHGSRRTAPTLRGSLEKRGDATRVVFQIDADPWLVWPMLLGFPVASVGAIALAFYLRQLVPALLVPLLAVMLVFGFASARNDSKALLQFFVDLIADAHCRDDDA